MSYLVTISWDQLIIRYKEWDDIDCDEDDEDNDTLNSRIADDANYDSNDEVEISTTS